MDYQTILVETAANITTVTINRPQAMNSFTKVMMDEFQHLWRAVAEDDSIHVVVLRAADGRAFSAGVDVKAASEPGGAVTHGNVWTAVDPGERLGPKSNKCWKPVVCAIHGLCAGGAFYWVSESDIVICSDDATFFDPHVTYGMTAALEPIGLTYRIPLGDVLRMALLGNDERICAETAKRIGLVSEITPRAELWGRAHSLAERIAAKPAIAIQGTVRAIWESLDMNRTTALNNGLKYFHIGNSAGTQQVDRGAVMGAKKTFEVR